MFRLFIYMVIVLGVAWFLSQWAGNPGTVTISWQNLEINTSFAVLVFAVAGVLTIGLLLQKLYVWAKREFPVIGENRHMKRQERGLNTLNKAVVALAAGDGVNARKLANQAAKLLPPQPMMHVVAAQAAKLTGDTEAARKEFEGLLQDPDAAFLGVRGLLVGAVADGKVREARRLAEKAKEINPKSAWAIKTLFDLQVKATDWKSAMETLEAGKHSKVFTKDEVKSLFSTLYYCQAKEAELANEHETAEKLVQKALKSRKDFLPLVLMASRLESDKGNKNRALKILETAWALIPHPEIAERYAKAEPVETETVRYGRLQRLTKKNPDHTESLLVLAAQAIKAKKYIEAGKHLDAAMEQTSRVKVFQLRADLEEARDATSDIISRWQQKAKEGTAEPLWKCSSCAAEAGQWALLCTTCRMFNTLEWLEGENIEPALREEETQDYLVMLPDPLKEKSAYSKKPNLKPTKK